MKFIKSTVLLLLAISFSASAQTIKVQPYLQDAHPHSIYILWETDSGEESLVHWGLTDDLGNTTEGTAQVSVGDARIHTVQLTGLEPVTKYFYQVQTGSALSEITQFKTPQTADHDHDFRIIAMSDMQRDNSFPDKFQEVVEEGIIAYLEDEYGGDLIDNLALVMIPGDLVVNGTNYSSWEETFFDPAANLFKQVPVYPVPGNHENNAVYFFQYFQLPENGSPGYEEHWWYKDYGNVRIIGLDSNSPFTNQEQLDWLDIMLDTTCEADSIDFVFAQLHHPHKSELWTPGELDYTGEVIERLEAFSTNCNKPSIHFFGHTHGYSRGHSRDHKHLWINVATAGGAIDNWGEFPNFDYDEFAVSQDEYGFVSVEVTDDADPRVVVKRISRGDQDVVWNNVVRDSVVVRVAGGDVVTPIPLAPIDVEIAPECVVLIAEPFEAGQMDATHGQSHWQVATLETGFDDPVAESWKNFENWYDEVDTQAADDLWDEAIMGLPENEAFWWRVRYRDRELNWSDWSEPVPFTTGASLALPNLLMNPGAEDSLTYWTVQEGVVEALTANICDGVSPNSGDRYFIVGGLCDHSAVAIAYQDVDVSAYADSIDLGTFPVHFGGYLSNYGGSDLPEARLLFLDAAGLEIGASLTISTLNNSWTHFNESMPVPADTRTIRLELMGTRNAGTDNDSYFDDLFLMLGTQQVDCQEDPPVAVSQRLPLGNKLRVTPNPLQGEGKIDLPGISSRSIQLMVVDQLGQKMHVPVDLQADGISFQTSNLPGGTYFFWLRKGKMVVGAGKFVVQ